MRHSTVAGARLAPQSTHHEGTRVVAGIGSMTSRGRNTSCSQTMSGTVPRARFQEVKMHGTVPGRRCPPLNTHGVAQQRDRGPARTLATLSEQHGDERRQFECFESTVCTVWHPEPRNAARASRRQEPPHGVTTVRELARRALTTTRADGRAIVTAWTPDVALCATTVTAIVMGIWIRVWTART